MSKEGSKNRDKFLKLLNENLELIQDDMRVEYIDALLNSIYETYEESSNYAKKKNIDFETAYFSVRRQKGLGIELGEFCKYGC